MQLPPILKCVVKKVVFQERFSDQDISLKQDFLSDCDHNQHVLMPLEAHFQCDDISDCSLTYEKIGHGRYLQV